MWPNSAVFLASFLLFLPILQHWLVAGQQRLCVSKNLNGAEHIYGDKNATTEVTQCGYLLVNWLQAHMSACPLIGLELWEDICESYYDLSGWAQELKNILSCKQDLTDIKNQLCVSR